ncbi:hypothetical protein WAI453_007249 [Rhynchosporium graminicola]
MKQKNGMRLTKIVKLKEEREKTLGSGITCEMMQHAEVASANSASLKKSVPAEERHAIHAYYLLNFIEARSEVLKFASQRDLQLSEKYTF